MTEQDKIDIRDYVEGEIESIRDTIGLEVEELKDQIRDLRDRIDDLSCNLAALEEEFDSNKGS